jgi:chain length determinant protein EpsF
VITISFKAPDAVSSAVTANAFADAYREIALALRVEPAREFAKLFESQADALRETLTAAQNRLLEYQQKKGIVVNDQRLDFETARLNELSAQLTVAQGQTAEARSRQNVRGAADTHPEIVQNPLIQGLKIEIARQEAKLSELSRNVGKNHPQYQQVEAEIAALNARLEMEVMKISKSFSTSGSVSTAKQAELRAAVAEQRRKLLELQSQRGELAALVRDVDAAQRAFDAVSQRFSQTSLESQSNTPTVAVLTRASEPIQPVFPRFLLNTALAIFFGALLGVGIALILEMFDTRVRIPADIATVIEPPLLGVVPPRRAGFFRAAD